MPGGLGFNLLPDLFQDHARNSEYLIRAFQPDIYFTTYDVFVSAWMAQQSAKAGFSKTRWLSYFVWDVERWSAPRWYQTIFNRCDIPVAMSKYGQDSVTEFYGIHPHMIYHGVDMQSFPELPKETIQQRREQWGNPEFVMGAFFRNIIRKQTARLLEAWSRVSREYPDVRLLVNMRPQDREGYDMVAYASHFNIMDKIGPNKELLERGPLILSNQQSETFGIPLSELNLLYQCCDAQVLPTLGEGFGLPIIEGYAACGLPVIMSRNTTYDELVGDHGLPIECEQYSWSRNAGAQVIPSTDSLEDAMRIMIDDGGLRAKFRERNREFVKAFDYDAQIIPEWIKLLENEMS